MSTRTDWGWFDKDGQPVAVGDEWRKWECPQKRYEHYGYEHPMTGEWVDEGYHPVSCRTIDGGYKRDVCPTCGAQFIYP